jgi:phosphoribosylaminoimidazole-succinocarboxamide synthase
MKQGADPKSLDKEYVRRWLVAQGFEGHGDPPALPDDIRIEAARRYIETFERLTGEPFVPDTTPPEPRLRTNLNLH